MTKVGRTKARNENMRISLTLGQDLTRNEEKVRTTMPPVSNPYELSTELCGCEDWSSGWEEYVDPTTVGGTLLSSRVMFGCA